MAPTRGRIVAILRPLSARATVAVEVGREATGDAPINTELVGVVPALEVGVGLVLNGGDTSEEPVEEMEIVGLDDEGGW